MFDLSNTGHVHWWYGGVNAVSSTLLILQMVKRPRNQQNGKERHHTIWQLGLGPVDTDQYTVAVRDKNTTYYEKLFEKSKEDILSINYV